MLKRHPLSAIWGDMPEVEYAELVDSVRKDGVLDYLIKTLEHEGEPHVLDGWHRYSAAHDSGKTEGLILAPYLGDDPVGFVIARNAVRRHLTAGQRAICVAKCYEWAGPGSNQHLQKKGVTTRYTLEEENADGASADHSPDEVRGREGVGEVGADRTPTGDVRSDDERRSSAATGEALGPGQAEASATEGMVTGSEDALTARLIAEKAQTTRKTAEEAKAIIRGGLAEAVLGGEMSFDAALRQARGKPKEPTKAQRLEAERDGLALDVQDKATRLDELEDQVRFHEGNMDEQESERHKAFIAVQAELSTARSQINEWMTKHNEELRSRRYWERWAKANGWTADEVKGE